MNRITIVPANPMEFEDMMRKAYSMLDQLAFPGTGKRAVEALSAHVSPPPYEEPANKPVNPKFRKRDNDILADVKQVIYNDPATIVTFSDGTKVCVKAANGDKFSKELGLMYAIVKRLYANDVDKNFYLRSKGLGDKIARLVEGGIDQKEAEKKRKEAKLKKSLAKKDSESAKVADEIAEQAATEDACQTSK